MSCGAGFGMGMRKWRQICCFWQISPFLGSYSMQTESDRRKPADSSKKSWHQKPSQRIWEHQNKYAREKCFAKCLSISLFSYICCRGISLVCKHLEAGAGMESSFTVLALCFLVRIVPFFSPRPNWQANIFGQKKQCSSVVKSSSVVKWTNRW